EGPLCGPRPPGRLRRPRGDPAEYAVPTRYGPEVSEHTSRAPPVPHDEERHAQGGRHGQSGEGSGARLEASKRASESTRIGNELENPFLEMPRQDRAAFLFETERRRAFALQGVNS